MDLTTHYLGLKLKNPLAPSASPLSRDVDMARRLEDAGASAIVMYSLFEEEILAEQDILHQLWSYQDIGHGEADSYLPVPANCETCLDQYLAQLWALKQSLDIPVIASLNGVTPGGWLEHAADLQQAGADALELNIWFQPVDPALSAADVEDQCLQILRELRPAVSIPITLKLSSQYTAPVHFIKRLAEQGADGVSLFNRFYQPDLDLETLRMKPTLRLSNSYEALLRMHWVALLFGRVDLSLAATGGIHGASEVIKLLLAGADVTHLCSTLLRNGPERITTILRDLEQWMTEHDYESVEQLKGSFSQRHSPDPGAWERANYLEVLREYPFDGGGL